MSAIASRQSFGEEVAVLAEKNPNIVVMDADLGKSTMTGAFAKKFPDRYLEMGIAEQNLIGTAAGLAMAGKIPFAASFACFLVGRYETIRMSVAYAGTNVKLVGTHAGAGIGEDGYSQMGLEDIAMLRSLPNMAIVQPADDLEARQSVQWAAQYNGPVYLRLTRQKLPDLHKPDYKFQFGKADVLKPFASAASPLTAVIFCTGGVVAGSLKAAQDLQSQGIDAAVVNIHTIKPLDEETVHSICSKTRNVVVVEDHNVIGGLASAISETAAIAGLNIRMKRIGLETFGESGSPEGLYEKFGFTSEKISRVVQEFVKA